MASPWNRVEGFLFGSAIAGAFSRAIEAVLEPVKQHAWSKNPVKVFDVGTLGALIAKGLSPESALTDEATRTGYNADRLRAEAALQQAYPGTGELDAMSNRKVLSPELVDKALSRHGIPAEYHAAVKALFSDLLDPAQTAAAIHRNIIPDPGLLVGQQPGPDRKVPIFPQVPIDALKEAAGQGLDEDRLRVLVGLQGLPMGPHEAAQALFRDLITHDDFLAAIAQSNTRNEWADAILQQTRQLPTARDFMENALRGHHDFAWAAEQAARHGMHEEDAFIIYQNQGRPLNLHQISQAIAWGAKYQPGQGDNPDPWMQSVLLGAVRPEYYEMQDSLKYIVPSAFALRTLQQTGALTPDEAFVWYKRLGWEPGLSRQVADAFGKHKAATEKEASAAELLALYDGEKRTQDETLAALVALGFPADEAVTKMDVLDARRVASARSTTISDLHAAFKKRDLPASAAEVAVAQLVNDPVTATQIVADWQVYLDAFPPAVPGALPPTLDTFTPASGPVGTVVTLTGTNLTGALAVTLGSISAGFTATSDTEISATVPASAVSAQWRVRTPGGTATSLAAFTVV